MDNMVKTFVNEEFGSVRTIEENGKILFCGSDVAKALGYRRPKDAINAHCKGAVKRRLLTNGGTQEMKMISEVMFTALYPTPDFPLLKNLKAGYLMMSFQLSAEQAAMFQTKKCLLKTTCLSSTNRTKNFSVCK